MSHPMTAPAAATPTRGGRIRRLREGADVRVALSEAGLRLTAVVAFGVVWQIVTSVRDSVFFPTMTEILSQARETWLSGPADRLFLTDAVFDDVVPSLVRLLAGWLLAVVVGIVGGFAIGRSRTLADFVDPIVHFVRAIPPPALLPLFLVLLGRHDAMKIALIAFGVVWPILLNTIDGVRSVDPLQLETGRVFGVGRSRRMSHIIMPAAAPKIFAGLRVSLSIAVILMVISEMVAATDGIGFEVVQAQRTFRILDMWAGILLLSVLGYVLNTVLLGGERVLLRWHRGAHGRDRSR